MPHTNKSTKSHTSIGFGFIDFWVPNLFCCQEAMMTKERGGSLPQALQCRYTWRGSDRTPHQSRCISIYTYIYIYISIYLSIYLSMYLSVYIYNNDLFWYIYIYGLKIYVYKYIYVYCLDICIYIYNCWNIWIYVVVVFSGECLLNILSLTSHFLKRLGNDLYDARWVVLPRFIKHEDVHTIPKSPSSMNFKSGSYVFCPGCRWLTGNKKWTVIIKSRKTICYLDLLMREE